jgi:drug/metabolite transporter (DMT)-like permease
MPLFPLALVVLAAFIHATWNLLSKRAAAGGSTFVFFSSLAAGIIYLPWLIWVLTDHEQIRSLWTTFCILLSGAIHLAYSLCLQRGYQVADLSVVYPVARGTGPMLSSLGAFLLLRETPTAHGLLGLLAVVTGIGLISTQGDLSAFRRPAGQEGVRWGFVTGALIASYTLVDGYGVKALGVQPVVLDWFSNFLRVVLLIPVMIANRKRMPELMKGRWSLAIGVGALSPLSYILVLTALDWGAPLSLVAPAREMSMMVGAIFGMVLLREKVNVWRLAGCLILILGVVLLGFH